MASTTVAPPNFNRELLALKKASSRISQYADQVHPHTSIDFSDVNANIEIISASRDRTPHNDAPSLRLPLTSHGHKEAEVGGKAWIYNADGATTDSYQKLAGDMDALGMSIRAKYGGGKYGTFTPGQFAAHASLLAFKGKTDKLRSELNLTDDEIRDLHKHTAVLMGAEVGRTPLAGVSNFLMLHRMKHTSGSAFSGTGGTLTAIQQRQLATQSTTMDTNTFLSAPYGSIGMMNALQQSIDAFPSQPDARYSKAATMAEKWEGAFSGSGKSWQFPGEEFVTGGKVKSAIAGATFRARNSTNDGNVELRLPNPLDVATNEAQRLRGYVGYKAGRHPDRADPEVALEKGVLKHFKPFTGRPDFPGVEFRMHHRDVFDTSARTQSAARTTIDDIFASSLPELPSPHRPTGLFEGLHSPRQNPFEPGHHDITPSSIVLTPTRKRDGSVMLFDIRNSSSSSHR